jgi:hypothetical protein
MRSQKTPFKTKTIEKNNDFYKASLHRKENLSKKTRKTTTKNCPRFRRLCPEYSWEIHAISLTINSERYINLSRALGRFSAEESQENKDKWFSEELTNRYNSEESVTTLIDLSS